jgi:hypothetical protein
MIEFLIMVKLLIWTFKNFKIYLLMIFSLIFYFFSICSYAQTTKIVNFSYKISMKHIGDSTLVVLKVKNRGFRNVYLTNNHKEAMTLQDSVLLFDKSWDGFDIEYSKCVGFYKLKPFQSIKLSKKTQKKGIQYVRFSTILILSEDHKNNTILIEEFKKYKCLKFPRIYDFPIMFFEDSIPVKK